jgi:hypothetical protein
VQKQPANDSADALTTHMYLRQLSLAVTAPVHA